ncbi:MAG: c-type cytochrome [Campylobacterota bacterium]|nr:c-type cytochrome [Campylobacterota bacterium]
MKYTVSLIAVLLLLGCTSEHNSTKSSSTQELKEKSPKIIKEVAPVVVAKTEPVAEATPVVEASFDVAGAFKRKCGGCHGTSGEKAALGKSQVIKGWETSKTLTALTGYKDGSYGGAMKGLMASQVSSFSQSNIEALAEYISKL